MVSSLPSPTTDPTKLSIRSRGRETKEASAMMIVAFLFLISAFGTVAIKIDCERRAIARALVRQRTISRKTKMIDEKRVLNHESKSCMTSMAKIFFVLFSPLRSWGTDGCAPPDF